MLRSVSRLCQPRLNTLFYGNDNLSVSDNKQIFITVLNRTEHKLYLISVQLTCEVKATTVGGKTYQK